MQRVASLTTHHSVLITSAVGLDDSEIRLDELRENETSPRLPIPVSA